MVIVPNKPTTKSNLGPSHIYHRLSIYQGKGAGWGSVVCLLATLKILHQRWSFSTLSWEQFPQGVWERSSFKRLYCNSLSVIGTIQVIYTAAVACLWKLVAINFQRIAFLRKHPIPIPQRVLITSAIMKRAVTATIFIILLRGEDRNCSLQAIFLFQPFCHPVWYNYINCRCGFRSRTPLLLMRVLSTARNAVGSFSSYRSKLN